MAILTNIDNIDKILKNKVVLDYLQLVNTNDSKDRNRIFCRLVQPKAFCGYLGHLIDNQSEDVNKNLLKDCIKRSGNETLDEAEVATYILKELWSEIDDYLC